MGRQRSARSPFGRLRDIGLWGQHSVALPRSVLPAHAITASPLRFSDAGTHQCVLSLKTYAASGATDNGKSGVQSVLIAYAVACEDAEA